MFSCVDVCWSSKTHVITANAGDSRSVLYSFHGTKESVKVHTEPLSFDHKPGDEKEMKRVEEAGLRVLEIAGVMRVNGDLGMFINVLLLTFPCSF